MYSLERRPERYIIIYVWKVQQGLTTNIGGSDKLHFYRNNRRGLLCSIPPLNRRAPARLQSLREGSFAVLGPRLYNLLPAAAREYSGDALGFKQRVDRFLSGVPDRPSLPAYHQSAANNSLIQQVQQLRREHGGVFVRLCLFYYCFA